ncbi:S-adenosyl-L-methionine:benzoic acid/salicylic acid carboxyl methyltransferase 3 [Stylosanthes scabra]|uniref:S-adenosyl-L-methionine:benzoic acid/salicylic acid carboxyl methyltransferase 3 n=1 Tax=Stylosanthes scabra TaxID=79078 RepID=A0ABU6ZGA8_9FABA|nr:S-adenosyl-L-methionine:benzoic acid/salicylic acid carboxyl methyltransferase 3 [Stylosanthes scabra]
MDVAHVLHMNGGDGETSYARNSYLQRKVICLTKGIREEAIRKVYCSKIPRSLVIADLGCSSGPNTFLVVSQVIMAVEKLWRELKHDDESPEYQVLMNDLPGNDFNNIFKSLHLFLERLSRQVEGGIGPCYVNGVPGSFYGRIFPTNTLHFVHSSYSLMWLSQVPEGVENNKGNIYMWSTSPLNVFEAYYEQFQRDFSWFLKCRAQEVVEGGCMVLTFLGRRSEDPSSKECCYIWQLLAMALNEMVAEGIIKEEDMDKFNIPQYTPSPWEVKSEVMKEGSFSIDRLEVSEVHWNPFNDDDSFSGDGGYHVANLMRPVAEPLLANHFGEAIIEDAFRRYQRILTSVMSKETTTMFINVSVSMTRTVVVS